jgi:hypothetical protein
MDSETLQEIRTSVRSGFSSPEEIVTEFCEERYEPGELDPGEVEKAVAAETAALREEQKSWPKETDCDRLAQAFEALIARGVIAIENAGYTQSDGYDDVTAIYEDSEDKHTLVGYCYYHGQDLERAVRGEGLILSFGPMDPEMEQTEGPRVGRIIVEELERRGLRTRWDGTFKERIHVPQLDWKRRFRP